MTSDPMNSASSASQHAKTHIVPLFILAAALGAILGHTWSQLEATPLSSDQIGIATLLLKYGNPQLFPTEHGLRPLHIYPNSYLGIMHLLTTRIGDVKHAFFCLGALTLIVFAAGMYRLLLETVRSAWIALAVTVASLWFRAAFEGQEWQVSDFGAFLPRTITLAMIPWLLLACGRQVGRWPLVGVFAALGIAGNYHPLSALYLAVIFGLALLLMFRHCARHIPILAASVMVFCLATAPYFLAVNYAFRVAAAERRAAGVKVTPEQIEEARRQTPHGTFPPPFATLRWVGFHLALPALAGAAGILRRRRNWGDRERVIAAFLAGVLIFSVGGAAVEAVLRAAGKMQKSYIFLRAFNLVYLPLFVFCAWLIEDLWNRSSLRARLEQEGPTEVGTTYGSSLRARLGAIVLAAALLIPASVPEYAIRYVKYRGQVPQRQSLEHDRDFMAMCDWVRTSTKIADTFVVPPGWNHFALFAQRSIVASAKEVSFILYEPEVGVAVFEKIRAVQAAYDNPSPDALLAAARRYGARYVVTLEKGLAGQPVFQSDGYLVYEVRW